MHSMAQTHTIWSARMSDTILRLKNGFNFSALFEIEGLHRLDEEFLARLRAPGAGPGVRVQETVRPAARAPAARAPRRDRGFRRARPLARERDRARRPRS